MIFPEHYVPQPSHAKAVNPPIDGLDTLVQDSLVEAATLAVEKFMAQSVSRDRGTVGWLYNLRNVGSLLMMLDREQFSQVLANVKSSKKGLTPSKKKSIRKTLEDAGFDTTEMKDEWF